MSVLESFRKKLALLPAWRRAGWSGSRDLSGNDFLDVAGDYRDDAANRRRAAADELAMADARGLLERLRAERGKNDSV